MRTVLPLLLAVWVAVASPISAAAQATAAAAQPGYQLSTLGGGVWGDLTAPLQSLVNQALNDTGLTGAATAAQSTLSALSQGKVPIISDLQDPFRGNVEGTVENALDQGTMATAILNEIAGQAAKEAFATLANSPLVVDGEIAFTLPTGRVRLMRAGANLSLCVTVIGPAGSRVTAGISNADPLCGVPAERFANEGGPVVAFVDLAVGYTHMQARQMLAPSLSAPLTTPAPSLTGETFVQINGQWVKVALAANDPDAIFLEAEVSVGLAGGVQYYARADVEGTAALTFEVKPFRIGEVIQGAADAMLTAAQEEGATALTDHLDPEKAAAVVMAGLEYLSQVEEELGEIGLSVGAEGALGLGMWDTSIAGASASGFMTASLPLESYLAMGADNLALFLGIGLTMGETVEDLSTAVLEGKSAAAVDQIAAQAGTAATKLVEDVFANLVEAATDLSVSFEYEVALAGEPSGTAGGGSGAPQNIPIINHAVEIPVGAAIETLRDDPEALLKAVEAAARVVTTAVAGAGSLATGITRVNPPTPTGTGPKPVTTQAEWHSLTEELQTISLGMLNDTTVTFMFAGSPLVMTGMEEVPLGTILELMENHAQRVVPVLTGVVEGARSGNLDTVRSAIDSAISQIGSVTEDTMIDLLKAYTLPVATGIGTNFEIGAEGQAELGLGGRLEGRLKASTLLLLAGHGAYDEEHETQLASLSLPMSFSLSGGASVGEGVEFKVGAGGTLGFSLFDLTLTHWEGDLPTPAAMQVAGFEVIDFTGTVREDESFTGSGFLVLPMGGIVAATFDVDSEGHVVSGTWEGGVDLGPLGKLTLAAGEIKDDGLHGDLEIPILESKLKARYNLQSSGLLFGKYEGNLVIAGRTLSSTSLELRQDGLLHGTTMIDVAGTMVKFDLQVGLLTGQVNGSATTSLTIAGQQVSNLQLTLNGATLSGQGSFNLLGNSARFDVTVSPTGGVTGSYRQGANEVFGVAGFGLSNVALTLDQNGFAGTAKLTLPGITVLDLKDLRITPQGKLTATAQSSLDLFGFATNTNLTLTENGLTGTGSMQVLGSPLAASDLTIHSNGSITGNFKGNLTVAGHTLSDISVQLQNDGLAGNTKMDLPGVAKANLTLLLKGGQVTARYDGQITMLGYHATQLFFTFTPDKVMVKGSLQDDVVEFLNGETKKAVNALADGARSQIIGALALIDQAKRDVANMDVTIREARALAERDRLAAQQAVRDAEAALQAAIDALDDVLDAVAALEQDFRGRLYDAERELSKARTDVNNARWVLDDLSRQIRDLENWYNGLNDWDKFWNAAGFGIKWAALQTAKGAADVGLTIASDFLWLTEEGLRTLRNELNSKLAPLLDKKNLRQQIYNDASAALKKASQDLQNIPVNLDLHPLVAPQLVIQAGLREGLRAAEFLLIELNRTLGALPELVDQIDRLGLNQVVNVNTASFEAELGALFTGRFAVRVNGVFMGQARTMALDLNLADPVGSAASLANAFVSAASADELPPDGSEPEPPADAVAPVTIAAFPVGWQKANATISLNAIDNVGGAGVAAIMVGATGAQPMPQTSIAGAAANIEITAEGVTTLSYQARDAKGNLEAARTGQVFIDRTAPQTTAIKPESWQNSRAAVQVTAVDNLSGIASITYAATGAQPMEAVTLASNTVTIQISTPGQTTITYYATDNAGNVSATGTMVVMLDRTAPTAAATAPAAWTNQPAAVSITAADEPSGSGVASVTYSAAGAQTIAAKTVPGDAANFQITAEGVTTVTYFATDVAGNAGAPQTVTVRIDKTKPQVTAGAPAAWQNQPVTVSFSALDDANGSGIASITVSAAGAENYDPIALPKEITQVEVKTEGVTTLTYFTTDAAGNVSQTRSVTIRIDLTAPTAAAEAPQHWVNHPVNVRLTAADEAGGSGVAAITYSAEGAQPIGPTTVSGAFTAPEITAEGITTITYYATDVAGNVGAIGTITVKLDLTNPDLSGAPDRAPNQYGWYNAPVTVGWTCADSPSGIDPNGGCPEAVTLPTAGAGQSVTRTARDVAGNTTTVTVGSIHIDLTSPTSAAEAPTHWVNHPVNVRISAADEAGGAGVDTITYSATGAQPIATTIVSGDFTAPEITAEGITTVTYYATDRAGNVGAMGSITVKLDLTNPTISGAPDRAPNHHGWYNAPVTISWTCADTPSGIDPNGGCPEAVTLPNAGADQSVTRTARDVAGNTTDATVSSIHIDLVAPTITFHTPVDKQVFTTDQTLTLDFSAADELSSVDIITATLDGNAVVDGQAINLTDKAGFHTLTVTVVDRAGNTTTRSVTYQVLIKAQIACDPSTLNRTSGGEWITCWVEFPLPYSANAINGASVRLNGAVAAYLGKQGWAVPTAVSGNTSDADGDGLPERMVKFDRAAVAALLATGDAVPITLTGEAGGLAFTGTTTIRVLDGASGQPKGSKK
ncbi:MAG: hypothetical protein K0R39_2950 [Symbiobacteriaceae bacterium]|jgi:hypothetical protein|nr:hypothetical protein [Symbiobacteriaceae bacterium]